MIVVTVVPCIVTLTAPSVVLFSVFIVLVLGVSCPLLEPFLKPTAFDDVGQAPYTILFKEARGVRCGVCSSTQNCRGHQVKSHHAVDIRNGKVSFALMWDSELIDNYILEKYKVRLRCTVRKVRNLELL